MVMLFASTNLFVLSRECLAFKVGMMSTIFEGCHRLCYNYHCSDAVVVWPRGMYNTFIDACLVVTNGSSSILQVDITPESTIGVITLVDSGGVTDVFVTVSASSTCTVIAVSWV